jgi:hypothetical protein
MINTSTIKRFACLLAIAAAFVLVSGSLREAQAQRDPFKKAGWAIPKKPVVATPGKVAKAAPPVVVNYGPPAIEARIEYYKHLRETAVANGAPLPKVTSVLTLNEMAVTGIFKTPRGYAAMVEATPIKLSYTIYPGEKFFDGQLVAVEENRLVFRKVTKVSDGKFVASVENKPLKQFSMKAQIEGTAPTQPTDKPTEVAKTTPVVAPGVKSKDAPKPAASNQFLSPLDEMNNQTGKPDSDKDKAKKPAKKPVKVARNSGKE